MVVYVGEKFHAIASTAYTSPFLCDSHFCDSILHILLEDSFSPNVATISSYLRESIPVMFRLLKERTFENRCISIAHESASHVGYSLDGLNREDEIRLSFESALLVLHYVIYIREEWAKNPSFLFMDYQSVEQYYSQASLDPTIKKGYPLDKINDMEKRRLIQFSNFMKLALTLFPKHKLKREHLIDIVTRAAEERKRYITGTGQSSFTSRRVAIYHMETGVVPLKFESRNGRKYKVDGSGEAKESSDCKRKSSELTAPSAPVIETPNFILPFPFNSRSDLDAVMNSMTFHSDFQFTNELLTDHTAKRANVATSPRCQELIDMIANNTEPSSREVSIDFEGIEAILNELKHSDADYKNYREPSRSDFDIKTFVPFATMK